MPQIHQRREKPSKKYLSSSDMLILGFLLALEDLTLLFLHGGGDDADEDGGLFFAWLIGLKKRVIRVTISVI